MPEQRPYTLRIFVPDGDPDGLRVIEKSNWTGVGVVFTRSNFKQAVSRLEFEKTGVYVLVGTDEEGTLPTIYIGEGEPVKNRINAHYVNKDFWDWAIFFVSKDHSLNKAHVKHLEARLLGLAREAKQCKINNDGSSLPPTLSESEAADIESFLLDILSIFPLVGLGVFEKTIAKKKTHELLHLSGRSINATGFEDPKGFVVCAGSQMAKTETTSIQNFYSALRADLIEQGVVADKGDHFVFVLDHVFTSPSMAAGIVQGRSANGRLDWKLKDGTTLKEIQTALAKAHEESE